MFQGYSKYGAKKTVVDGITFASKKEAKRYGELQLLLKAGEITDLILQPRFILQEKFTVRSEKIRAIEYVGDFQYIYNGETIVEDVKGMLTEVFKLKSKMFKYKYQDIILKEM